MYLDHLSSPHPIIINMRKRAIVNFFKLQSCNFVESGLCFYFIFLPHFRLILKVWATNAKCQIFISSHPPLSISFSMTAVSMKPGVQTLRSPVCICVCTFVFVCRANGFSGEGVGYLLPCVIECNDYQCCVM